MTNTHFLANNTSANSLVHSVSQNTYILANHMELAAAMTLCLMPVSNIMLTCYFKSATASGREWSFPVSCTARRMLLCKP